MGLIEDSMRAGDSMLMKTEIRPVMVSTGQEIVPIKRVSRARFAIAFGVAAISDFLSMWTEFAPPIQWVIDLGTAGLLFLILGRRWALLPGLIAEAIPGMGVFPVWVLVVMSHHPLRRDQRAQANVAETCFVGSRLFLTGGKRVRVALPNPHKSCFDAPRPRPARPTASLVVHK